MFGRIIRKCRFAGTGKRVLALLLSAMLILGVASALPASAEAAEKMTYDDYVNKVVGTYLDIVGFIKAYGAKPGSDLRELWKRMVLCVWMS